MCSMGVPHFGLSLFFFFLLILTVPSFGLALGGHSLKSRVSPTLRLCLIKRVIRPVYANASDARDDATSTCPPDLEKHET